MNLIPLVGKLELTRGAFKIAVGELQHIEEENIEVLLLTHSGNSKMALEIKNHFESLRARGSRAEGAFVIPKVINIWYHDGLSETCWLVLGTENVIYSPGV